MVARRWGTEFLRTKRIAAFAAALVLTLSPASAADYIDTPLNEARCETFTVGESGHSDWCKGPLGYGLVVHYRQSRIDLEITRPHTKRGAKVHRLVNYLGDGQRRFSQNTVRWLIDGDTPKAFALKFNVEPRPNELAIPYALVFRLGDAQNDCVIASLGESSRRSLDSVMERHRELTCRTPFSAYE